jgi:hypothetical protein
VNIPELLQIESDHAILAALVGMFRGKYPGMIPERVYLRAAHFVQPEKRAPCWYHLNAVNC